MPYVFSLFVSGMNTTVEMPSWKLHQDTLQVILVRNSQTVGLGLHDLSQTNAPGKGFCSVVTLW